MIVKLYKVIDGELYEFGKYDVSQMHQLWALCGGVAECERYGIEWMVKEA